ncbi:hypothetical protein M2451_001344 [Dysgonomonas sp. PFB1-18]|uniref:DUF4405 domain-containing protein n=1 Tax=unclassified Dysgonomonas TaxID=2630389 RepID=UPI002474C77D|nr:MULTISPECIES: DUF4405 domain-containing protein [unclassified Dysgonomonas]MDL2303184.1 DUF4405 domain-containing protein [Dysgonomonas sp. OttesenSCG-928-D17]MDH6308778.1 hypothetical protein [Dysgonomonas sp. PF1-14]MDH6338525.1 hypothetical protein [Dysgonomonas sp. PF1-16]MDH6380027.1 hypothetical protein [Dysgonomonas sp. PFB1-18]MDH6397353.1 hypothetical protein [Dysgonomonas sp. PF1-23]
MAKSSSLTKGKSIFIIDALLIPVFILLTYTGLKLHVADHVDNHEVWAFWAHWHIVVGIVTLVLGYLHVKAHWVWYKGLIKNGAGKKSKVTIVISILFVILVVTGIILVFFIEGGNSSVGLWHYRLSLLMVALLIAHTVKRFPIMMKGLKNKRKTEKSKKQQEVVA